METRTPQPYRLNLNLNQTLPCTSASVGNPTRNKAMERFQKFIMKLAETRPNPGLTPPRKALLQDRLNQLISDYKTPDHPPYSAMVERAIKELHEKEGSTEEAISEFISEEYDDLPQAHSTFLSHHLGKLTECGYVTMTRDKRYMIPVDTHPISNAKSKRKTRKRKSRRVWESDSHRQHKKVKEKDCEVGSIEGLMVFDKYMSLSENGVSSEEKQNKRAMAANELECSVNLMPGKGDIDPPEFAEGISFALGEDKLEGELAKNVQSGDGQMERLEHQPDAFEAESREKMESAVDDSTEDRSNKANGLVQERSEDFQNLEMVTEDVAAISSSEPAPEEGGYYQRDELEVEPWIATDRRKHQELKKYFRRKKASPSRNEVSPFKMLPGSILPMELPHENHQSMPSTTLASSTEISSFHLTEETDVVKDVSSMHPPPPQPEECQQKMPKRRGRPPKHNPDTSREGMQVFKSLRRRSSRLMLVASKPDEI